MSRRYHTHPVVRWDPANWERMWEIRGPRITDPTTLRRRGEIQAFRVQLAKREPK
jgi:hypothetical protein